MTFRPYFAALSNGAVYLDTGECWCGFSPCVDFQCGKELIGFLPHPEMDVDPFAEPDIRGEMLWDFSGVDYSAGPHKATSEVAVPVPTDMAETIDYGCLTDLTMAWDFSGIDYIPAYSALWQPPR